ncbi:sensor histidine kinase [Chryseobacterium sp. T1]
MKKNQILFLHIFYWLLNLTFSILLPILAWDTKHAVFNVTFFIVGFIVFYINYFYIVPFFFNIKKLYLTIFGFFISVGCFVFFRYMTEELILPWFIGHGNYAKETPFWFYYFDNVSYSSGTLFISTALALFNIFFKREEERQQLIEEKQSAELKALKTQINPHFIFNSLNNIYSLVYQKSDKSLPAIEELSEMLRYSTKDLEKDFIPLKRELGYVKSLIGLEKLRIRNPEMVKCTSEIENEDVEISPMLLVPFVENAFKHGDFNSGELTIDLKEINNVLNFRIENRKRQGSKDHTSGIGIGNVKKRLALIYPNKHELNISDNQNSFVVELKIEL